MTACLQQDLLPDMCKSKDLGRFMTLFNTKLVDIPTQKKIMNILLKYRSYDVLINLLDSILLKVLNS